MTHDFNQVVISTQLMFKILEMDSDNQYYIFFPKKQPVFK